VGVGGGGEERYHKYTIILRFRSCKYWYRYFRWWHARVLV